MSQFEKHAARAEMALELAAKPGEHETAVLVLQLAKAQAEATLALAYATRGEPPVEPAKSLTHNRATGREGYVFTTELGCKVEVWTQNREIDLDGRKLPGTYLRLSMQESLPSGVRAAELRLTHDEVINLVEALEGQF